MTPSKHKNEPIDFMNSMTENYTEHCITVDIATKR